MANGIRVDFSEEEINRMSPDERSTVNLRLTMGLYRTINGTEEKEGLCTRVARHEEWLKTIWRFIWVIVPSLIVAALGVIWAGAK
jgi:hypothetical protein